MCQEAIFFLNKATVITVINIRNSAINVRVGMIPKFRANQLMPARGNRARRTIARKLACWVMKPAIAGE